MAERLVLVTGAGGLLGRFVTLALRARGLRVRATDRAVTAIPAGEGIQVCAADLGRDALGPLFEGVTEVVHSAGLFDLAAPEAALREANVAVARRVAEAALVHRVRRFIHVSSVTVHGRPKVVPCPESAPHAPGNAYERSKCEGERAVRQVAHAGLPVVVLRPSGIYGPYSRYGMALVFASHAIAAAGGGRGHRSVRGGPRITLVHVEDAAEAAAHLLFAEGVDGRAFIVADTTPRSWGEILGAMESWAGLPESRPIALSRLVARGFATALLLMPEGRRAKQEAALVRRFEALRAEHGLCDALRPRVERHALDYWLGDHVYDVGMLLGTGWKPRYPDALVGLRSTYEWYVSERWLPAPAAERPSASGR